MLVLVAKAMVVVGSVLLHCPWYIAHQYLGGWEESLGDEIRAMKVEMAAGPWAVLSRVEQTDMIP